MLVKSRNVMDATVAPQPTSRPNLGGRPVPVPTISAEALIGVVVMLGEQIEHENRAYAETARRARVHFDRAAALRRSLADYRTAATAADAFASAYSAARRLPEAA